MTLVEIMIDKIEYHITRYRAGLITERECEILIATEVHELHRLKSKP